jgi:tocopherol cyclase
MFKKVRFPEIYQGSKKKNRYFEGWYFKLVSKDESYAIALIPGISKNNKDPHAFIQVFFIDQRHEKPLLKTHYIRYDASLFKYTLDMFNVSIDNNHFSKEKVILDIQSDDLNLVGSFTLNDQTPIKKTLLSPSIMGFFGYFGFMECYHGVISMSHHLSGDLSYQNEQLTFNHGIGYLEKDWGKSFPRAYVWLQTNHFETPDVSFMFSYADIPFLGFYFKGLISVLHIQKKRVSVCNLQFLKSVI